MSINLRGSGKSITAADVILSPSFAKETKPVVFSDSLKYLMEMETCCICKHREPGCFQNIENVGYVFVGYKCRHKAWRLALGKVQTLIHK